MHAENNHDKQYVYYPLEISLKELIKLTEHATVRTRWTMIVLVLVSVLMGIAFYNTTPFSFAPETIASLYKFENLPVNNLTEQNEPKPLLDIYFGDNDFKGTTFTRKLKLNPIYRDGVYPGLQHFVCVEIFGKKDEDPADSLGKYIYDRLNRGTQRLLEQCRSDTIDFPKNLVQFNYFTTDLNRLLYDRYLYSDRRFRRFTIESEEIRHLLNEWKTITENPEKIVPVGGTKATGSQNATNKGASNADVLPENAAILTSAIKDFDLARFNRLLLEAAFKDDMYLSADIIPPREQRTAKELATHLAFDEHIRFVNIPFFNTSIEVNDLGAIGGISLIIVLLLLRFSLSREIKNLNLAFRQAFYMDQLSTFYHRVAMRVIFVIPKMEGESVNQTLAAGAKYVCFLPILTITFGVLYDLFSIRELGLYPFDLVYWHLVVEFFCLAIVWYLSFRCLERLMHIDEIWGDYHLIWEYYLDKKKESDHEMTELRPEKVESSRELLSALKKDALPDHLKRPIRWRVYNESKYGRYRGRTRLLEKWGQFWFGRLLSVQNLKRLIPFKLGRRAQRAVGANVS